MKPNILGKFVDHECWMGAVTASVLWLLPVTAFADNYRDCKNLAAREYEQCSASCDRNVDMSNRQSDRSGWGALNKSYQRQTDGAFEQAVRDGRLSQAEFDSYRRQQESISDYARGQQIANCESNCFTRKRNAERRCY